MGPEGIPASSEALRAAVVAHFGQVPAASGVSADVDTNDNAAETSGLDGAVSR